MLQVILYLTKHFFSDAIFYYAFEGSSIAHNDLDDDEYKIHFEKFIRTGSILKTSWQYEGPKVKALFCYLFH